MLRRAKILLLVAVASTPSCNLQTIAPLAASLAGTDARPPLQALPSSPPMNGPMAPTSVKAVGTVNGAILADSPSRQGSPSVTVPPAHQEIRGRTSRNPGTGPPPPYFSMVSTPENPPAQVQSGGLRAAGVFFVIGWAVCAIYLIVQRLRGQSIFDLYTGLAEFLRVSPRAFHADGPDVVTRQNGTEHRFRTNNQGQILEVHE
jgi:hypothetical protein